MPAKLPQAPFGAVYFRKSNPPREDWDRDYAQAAADGLNTFRHWFMWSAIERAPGRFDWDDCDRQLDLAAENGLATVIAEFTMAAPEWFQRKMSHAVQRKADGTPMASTLSPSVAVGGFGQGLGGAGALTLNDPEVHAAVMGFLAELAGRYKGHPGLLGYDVNNEMNYQPDFDHSDQTKAAFRLWLKAKYGDLDALAQAWHRYSYAEWDDIMPPRQVQPYAECLDWLAFREDNFYSHVADKIAVLRGVDPDARIISHGIAGAVTAMAGHGCNDWRAAEQVEIYGYTWIAARKGNQPWRNFFGGDLIRGAARGKPFWHAERQGGPLWMQPQVLGRDRDDGRVAEAADVRLWSLASFAAGARGMMNLRYRPLLDGPLFGAFGSYGMDGAPTDRSEAAAEVARWTNAPEQADVMAAKPVRGEIGILMIPEAQAYDHLLSHDGGFKTYEQAMWGAYRGFFDIGAQPDWVHVDDLDIHDTLYAPYPILLPEALARRLTEWIAAGGTLISEACPGYFGDRGRVHVAQPGNGLDAVFGAREAFVEFMPDIAGRNHVVMDGSILPCGGFRQSYALAGGVARGVFDDGGVAVVDHTHGKGRTRLIGSHVSAGYWREREAGARVGREWFSSCLEFAGRPPRVSTGNPHLVARLHEGDAGRFLWVVNPTRTEQTGTLRVDGAEVAGTANWGRWENSARVSVPERDALVLKLA